MKYENLVVGSTGTVALEAIKFLTGKGESVRVGVRDIERANAMGLENIEICRFDYLDPVSFADALAGIQNWLLVSPPPYLNLQELVLSAVDQAKQTGVRRIIFISTFAVHGDDRGKKIETHIRNSGLEYSIIRPNLYMQNFSTFFRETIRVSGSLRIPAGDGKTSFVDVRDIAEIAACLMTGSGEQNRTIPVTGRTALSLDEVANILSSALDREISYVPVGDDEFRTELAKAGWTKASIEASVTLCGSVRKGLSATQTGEVEEIIGRPPITFDTFARDYSQVWKSSG